MERRPLSGNQRPDLLTSLMNMSLVPRLPRAMHLCRSSSNAGNVLETAAKPSRFAHFWQGAESLAHATQKTTSSLPKTGPRPSLFYTFHFQMCFAPHCCALFRHLDFQKCSEHGVFCKFYLGNVATTAYAFSSSQLPKVLRSCCVLYTLTWKCASRYSGVHFFDIATSKSAPRMMCFVRLDFEICFEPQLRAIFHLISPDGSAPAASASLLFDTFRPFVAPKHWQNTVIRDFLLFRALAPSFF